MCVLRVQIREGGAPPPSLSLSSPRPHFEPLEARPPFICALPPLAARLLASSMLPSLRERRGGRCQAVCFRTISSARHEVRAHTGSADTLIGGSALIWQGMTSGSDRAPARRCWPPIRAH